jgi:hypothetical protein
VTPDSLRNHIYKPITYGFLFVNHVDLVKSPNFRFSVIPAEAGIQSFQIRATFLNSGARPGPDPGSTGVTTFCEIINPDPFVKGRHSRAGGNPGSANILKRLDSRFHGNDAKKAFQTFYETINPE